MSVITILGASGFIGSHIVTRLRRENVPHTTPARNADLQSMHLGDVIYAIGLTADFRTRPFDTVEAHVCKLNELLRRGNFDKLVYLSSTRIYGSHLRMAEETADLQANPANPGDLYNLSKLVGESVTLQSGRRTCVVRLSNVYGTDYSSTNFLPSIIRDAIEKRKVVLQTTPETQKDYVSIEDVVEGVLSITRRGTQPIYNLASGQNTSNEMLANEISRLTGATFETVPDAAITQFPPISIDRMRREFGFSPADLTSDLARLVQQFSANERAPPHLS